MSTDVSEKLCLLPASRWFLACLIIRPWRWRRNIPSKRQLTFNRLPGVISQKVEIFINTDVRTSNPTGGIYIYHCVLNGEMTRRGMWCPVSDMMCDRTRHRGSLHAAGSARCGFRSNRGSAVVCCWRGHWTKSPQNGPQSSATSQQWLSRSRNIPPYMKPGLSLQCSQKDATGPYPKPDESKQILPSLLL
jgi:hypothetical protein